jgi:hypothetical protein
VAPQNAVGGSNRGQPIDVCNDLIIKHFSIRDDVAQRLPLPLQALSLRAA